MSALHVISVTFAFLSQCITAVHNHSHPSSMSLLFWYQLCNYILYCNQLHTTQRIITPVLAWCLLSEAISFLLCITFLLSFWLFFIIYLEDITETIPPVMHHLEHGKYNAWPFSIAPVTRVSSTNTCFLLQNNQILSDHSYLLNVHVKELVIDKWIN